MVHCIFGQGRLREISELVLIQTPDIEHIRMLLF